MKRFVLPLLLVLGSTSSVSAQVSEVVEGAGVKVGEGTVIHPILGVETGVVHNVFYEESDAVTSGLLRVTGELSVGSLPPERLQAPAEQESNTQHFGDLAFRADLRAQYEEYLSSNESVRSQRDIDIALLARGVVFPHRTWQFAFSEDLRRETRPVNFESGEDTDRDINRIGLELRYKPDGRALSGGLRYQNVIDYFEDSDQQFANRIGHTIGVGVGWQWLPVTRIYGDVSLGFFGPLGDDSTRPSSMPLRIHAGIYTALSVKTIVNARIGFGKGFYDTGPDFTNVTGGLQLGYRFSPHGRISGLYEYDFHDSINANYFRDHALRIQTEQLLKDRFLITAAVEARFRLYRGVISEVMTTSPDRSDVIFSIPIGATYNFRKWIAATLDYRFVTDQTDFRYLPEMGGPPDDPSYTRHTLMAGVRAAY